MSDVREFFTRVQPIIARRCDVVLKTHIDSLSTITWTPVDAVDAVKVQPFYVILKLAISVVLTFAFLVAGFSTICRFN
jgi:hypothetical protein